MAQKPVVRVYSPVERNLFRSFPLFLPACIKCFDPATQDTTPTMKQEYNDMRKQSKQTHRQKTWKIVLIQNLFFAVIIAGFMAAAPVLANDWGQVMVAPEKTKIRAGRTVDSPQRGFLDAGQKVKADFCKDHWCAVFPPDRQDRLEADALGYVHASRLKNAGNVKAAATTGQQLVVRGIRVIPGAGDRQTVFIALNQLAEPRLFPLKGENVRLVIDFSNVASVEKGLTTIEVGGNLIRRIRSHMDPRKHTFRVVLDLNEGMDYTVKQRFYEAENLYALELSQDKIPEEP